MKKRVLSFILVFCMLLTVLPLSVLAEPTVVSSGTIGANITWTLDSEGTLTLSGEGEMDAQPKWTKSQINKVIINEGITSIRYDAFADCTRLTEVILPATMWEIGTRAFKNCVALTKINLPQNGILIDAEAFKNSAILNNAAPIGGGKYIQNYLIDHVIGTEGKFVVANGTVGIATEALRNMGITEIELPSSLKTIGAVAFENDWMLKSIAIPDSVTYIGNCPFLNCAALTSIRFPAGLEELPQSVCSECPALKSVTFPENLKSIPPTAFFNCTSLTSIVIPDGVTVISGSAFSSCSALTSIKLPASVETIGGWAFENCTALKSIDLGSSLCKLNSYAFSGCTALETVTFSGTFDEVGAYPFNNTPYFNNSSTLYLGGWLLKAAGNADVAVPEGTVGIADGAFKDAAFSELTLPASMQKISTTLPKSISTVNFNGTYEQWLAIGVKTDFNGKSFTVNVQGEGGHEHDYSVYSHVDQTCTVDGYDKHECACGSYYVENYEEAAHKWGDWQILTDATCWETGVKRHTCSVCRKVENIIIPVKEHNFVDGVCTECGWHECPFTDIENSGYREYIETAAGLGIIAGYQDGTYRPNADVTRGQFVTFLWRLSGEPDATGTLSFPDVTPASPYYKAILWAAENGITTGYGDGTFRPSKVISRAEMSTFAFRFLIDPSKVTPELAKELYAPVGFKDENTIANAFKNPVCAMANLGIVTGFGDGTFRPNQTANRGQAAAIILRVYALLVNMYEE